MGATDVSGWKIQRALEAWKQAQDNTLTSSLAFDQTELSSLLEGDGGDVRQVLGGLLRGAVVAESNEESCGLRELDLAQRKARWKKRKESLLATALDLMQVIGKEPGDKVPTFRAPDLDAYVRPGRKGLQIDADSLPNEYVDETLVRKPRMTDIKGDHEQGVIIPGVSEKNPQPYLEIRTK